MPPPEETRSVQPRLARAKPDRRSQRNRQRFLTTNHGTDASFVSARCTSVALPLMRRFLFRWRLGSGETSLPKETPAPPPAPCSATHGASHLAVAFAPGHLHVDAVLSQAAPGYSPGKTAKPPRREGRHDASGDELHGSMLTFIGDPIAGGKVPRDLLEGLACMRCSSFSCSQALVRLFHQLGELRTASPSARAGRRKPRCQQ